ncbi:DUF4400 domain-containing protein [Methylobacter sp. S3L5C]|uniref:DUF4400 domain-containing protein n=1 Tax=Methylobacter sp. S3L5C TaxID=2839024 RepID=UPI001FAD7C3D|nr:DUF4400 domain-containing protein [Methylobacter sp. S3L5C]UOA07403.1 DUF4400 domain-containing protein [Methylobacter sp. S3L5C]
MQRNLLLSLLIWLLEIILVASFVSDRWTREIQAAEDRMLVAYIGVEKESEIRETSQKWFDRLFVRTGIKESIYRYFIPTERERQLSKGFEDVGRHDLFPFIQSRLDVLMGTVYQMIKRFIMAWIWLPFFMVTLPPFAVDGLIRRKVSQTNFDYPSPLAHRYSLYVILGAVYLLFMGLTLPFPIPPQSIPVGIFVVAFAMNVLLANTQKRI